MSAATSASPAERPAPLSRHRPALRAVAVLFVVAVLARAAFLAWHPPLDDHVYDVAGVRSHGPGTWLLMHALVGGPGVAVALTGLAVLVGAACRGRGAVLAAVGGVLASLGGLAFCVAVGAEGVAWWYATADGVLPPATGEAVMAAFEAHPLPVDVPALAGSLAGAVGVVLLALALRRAGAVRWWLAGAPVALAALSALPVQLPAAAALALAALEVVVLLSLGLRALSASTPRAQAPAGGGVSRSAG
ncbi:hypothetical protein [Quadrisphaera sp. KR29]|uniref:hypothetical protein n=1 Tax=Quadrisphaera sp. KR29 TaxID=3461391 RepID=UPI0040445084